jgi:hypothetical protein
MSFLSASDFDVIPLSIPNLDQVVNSFQDYLDLKEEEILRSLLGADLYDSFIAGLAEDYPEDRWVNLRDGSNYEYNSRVYAWVGVVKFLKPYIYSSWLRDTWDDHTGIGVVQPNAENSKVISPGLRIIRAWNQASNYAGDQCKIENSLYGFLSQTGITGTFDDSFDDSFQSFMDYLNFVFTPMGKMNRFDL